MAKIPLVKPTIPRPEKWQYLLEESYNLSTFSNFGPNYHKAINALKNIHQYANTHPVLVNNGTTAIQVALQATLPRGSRVAVPHFTFMATLNAVINAGMIPVIVESHPDDWTIDFDILERKHTEYDAFIVVSPMGHSVDIATYDDLALRLDKKVIYDFAAGVFNKVSPLFPTTLSFHATKNLPIGEGGAVLFNEPEHATRAEQLINFDFNSMKNPFTLYGFNGKMDEIHAAVLLYQLTEGLPDAMSTISQHQVIAQQYADALEDYFTAHPSLWDPDSNPQLTVLKAKSNEILTKTCIALEQADMSYRKYYDPTLFDMYAAFGIPKLRIPNHEHMRACLALPTYKNVPVLEICDIIIKALEI